MKYHHSIGGFLCILSLLSSSHLFGGEAIPLAATPEEASRLLSEAEEGRSVYLANLVKGDQGELFSGKADNLPAGRYRLHALVAAAPLGNLITGTVRLRLAAGEITRALSVIHLPQDDEFADLTLDLVSRGGSLPVRLDWLVEEDQKTKGLKGKRELAILKSAGEEKGDNPKEAAGAFDLAEEEEEGLQLDDESSTYTLAETKKTRYRLLLAGAILERLSPLEVRVRTGKITYLPGEPGSAEVTLINHGSEAVQVLPAVELRWGVDQVKALDAAACSVPAGGEARFTVNFPTSDLYWGAEVVVSAPAAGAPDGTGRQIFAVRKNIWETAITAAHPGHLGTFDSMERARKAAAQLREDGFNGFEAFFWGACDMLEFTPDQERWVSGQTAYPGSITGTRNLIQACRDEGIFSTVYANLWGGSGPPAMEIQRRHPEWFGNTNYNTWVLDDWELLGNSQDMQDARLRAPGIAAWCYNQIDVDPLPGLFDWHADELIGTQAMFGWNGVRYDSAYSREWMVKAMRQVRARVGKKAPDFQFGYNSFALNDYHALALDDMIGGAGMIMAEGIRIERTQHLTQFADEVLAWRDVIWPYGGHGPGMLFRNSTDEEVMTPVGIEYQASIILAAGGHLYYDPPQSERAHYPRFALRYSEYIYNNRMRALREPEKVISFPRGEKFLHWPRFVRTLDLGERRHRLVLHFINPPVEENPFKDKTLKVPVPLRGVPVALQLPPGAVVTGAWELDAAPDASHRKLVTELREGKVHLTIPEVRFWTALVLEYTAETTLPRAITLKDRTDTFLQEWQILGPFPADSELSTFDTPLPPKQGVDPAARYEGVGGKELSWLRAQPEGQPRLGRFRLDLREVLKTGNAPGIAYALTTVESKVDREVTLCMGYDDLIKVWVNRAEVFRSPKPEELQVDAAKVKVTLHRGKNEILVKIGQRGLAWNLALRIADADGNPIDEGLSY